MALTANVVKKAVTGSQQGINIITMTLTITDTAGAGFVKDYSVEYRTGDSIPVKVAAFIAQMNSDILIYKNQQAIFTAAALDTAVTNIAGGLLL
jgi:hypothetical protein